MQTDEYDEARRFVRQGMQGMHHEQMSEVDKEWCHAIAHGGQYELCESECPLSTWDSDVCLPISPLLLYVTG